MDMKNIINGVFKDVLKHLKQAAEIEPNLRTHIELSKFVEEFEKKSVAEGDEILLHRIKQYIEEYKKRAEKEETKKYLQDAIDILKGNNGDWSPTKY